MVGTGRADEIVGELRSILESTRTRTALAAVPARRLDESLNTLDGLADGLLELQTLVVLEDTSGDDMNRARAYWETLASDADLTNPRDLVSMSPTLSTLHRAAVTIRSVHRFSDERLDLARRLGEYLSGHPHYVGRLAANGRFPDFEIAATAVRPMRATLRDLERLGAISGFVLEGQIAPKEGKPYWRPDAKIPRGATPRRWRVVVGEVTPDYVGFLRGHWLTAYAYQIARDQFQREGEPFEIYANVQYDLPADLGGGRSDIDVLVRTADVLLCIECKSGRVLSGAPTAAAKTAHDAERLDALLVAMEVDLTRYYQLVYFETATETRETVGEAVAGPVPVLVTTPADVRSLVQRAAAGQTIEIGHAPCGDEEPRGSWLKVTSSGFILRLDFEAHGVVRESAYFGEEAPHEGTWRRTPDGQLELRIADWDSTLCGGPAELHGVEKHPTGSENRVALVRLG